MILIVVMSSSYYETVDAQQGFAVICKVNGVTWSLDAIMSRLHGAVHITMQGSTEPKRIGGRRAVTRTLTCGSDMRGGSVSAGFELV